MPSTFLTRVVLHNYKSIAACDVRLGALTYLVGPNGAGKSNFLDALHLVADALKMSLAAALNARWGVAHLLHRNAVQAGYLGIRLEFRLPDGRAGHYALMMRPSESAGFIISAEECSIGADSYQVVDGVLKSSTIMPFPAVSQDRLALVAVSGIPVFRAVFDALASMSIYNPNPQFMRMQQMQQDGRSLLGDGANIAAVLGYLRQAHGDVLNLIEDYLRLIVPGVQMVERTAVGPMETVLFRQNIEGQVSALFYANNMSDGTLRALAVLTALFQRNDASTPQLVGLEEPETALHPGAFAAVREAIVRASEQRQVIVVSHSPDLLDDVDLQPEAVLAVTSVAGATLITALDKGSRDAVETKLWSLGELLRLGQLSADQVAAATQQLPAPLWGNMVP